MFRSQNEWKAGSPQQSLEHVRSRATNDHMNLVGQTDQYRRAQLKQRDLEFRLPKLVQKCRLEPL